MTLSITKFTDTWLPALENAMQQAVAGKSGDVQGMYAMLRYHLGWEDQNGEATHAPQGKRVRPLVVLMASLAAGGDPEQALPAAAAVELLHNFSLIHDDIEDDSPTRRGRPTLWTWAGIPQAINTGDALFTIARLVLHDLGNRGVPADVVLQAIKIFDACCLHLTEGQYLDMSFETRVDVTVGEYLAMVEGKTAALLATSAELGALIASGDRPIAGHYRRFGRELGLSFQIQDDILGIWGDEALTGKSTASDILSRKKTLPVLYALTQPGAEAASLQRLYRRELAPAPDELPAIFDLLDRLGARVHAEAAAEAHAPGCVVGALRRGRQPRPRRWRQAGRYRTSAGVGAAVAWPAALRGGRCRVVWSCDALNLSLGLSLRCRAGTRRRPDCPGVAPAGSGAPVPG